MSNTTNQELVLVVDFGAQYAQLIARRVRQAQVYSEIVPSSMPIEKMLAKKPTAIILSGGPSSVYEAGAPTLDSKIFEAGIPIFGICYGFQVMASALGGVVTQTGKSEFGRTAIEHDSKSKLLAGLPQSFSVWMSHGDSVTTAPTGFTSSAKTQDTPIVAFENSDAKLAGVASVVKSWVDGDLDAFRSLKVRQPGGEFTQDVWTALRKVKAGQVISYADLAAKAGRPLAVRAAGTAMATNLIAPIVPCHRPRSRRRDGPSQAPSAGRQGRRRTAGR